MSWESTIAPLPVLGVGISAEFESHRSGIDAVTAKTATPAVFDFLEYGCDLDRGLDDHVRRWAERQWPTTYHFLDVNLEQRTDVDADWVRGTERLAQAIDAAWLCGDGGLWHFGPRDRAQMTLLPPVLCRASAQEMGVAIAHLQEETGYAVLPENPPATVYLGDMHLLDYYARVSDVGECGLLLDCAHLAIYQRMSGHDPLTALDGFPVERIVEMHIAGGTERTTEGFDWVEDDHNPHVLDDTWEIFDAVLPRAKNLRAVVYECERNPLESVLPTFKDIRRRLDKAGFEWAVSS